MQKAGTKKDVGLLGSWNGSGPMLWVDHLAGDYQLTLGSSGLSGYLDSGQTPTVGQWQYLAPPTTAAPPATTSTAPRSPAAA